MGDRYNDDHGDIDGHDGVTRTNNMPIASNATAPPHVALKMRRKNPARDGLARDSQRRARHVWS
eukprot:5481611-Lingulodinium_polyedra.AAC.1